MAGGRLFQTRGQATANALSHSDVLEWLSESKIFNDTGQRMNIRMFTHNGFCILLTLFGIIQSVLVEVCTLQCLCDRQWPVIHTVVTICASGVEWLGYIRVNSFVVCIICRHSRRVWCRLTYWLGECRENPCWGRLALMYSGGHTYGHRSDACMLLRTAAAAAGAAAAPWGSIDWSKRSIVITGHV